MKLFLIGIAAFCCISFIPAHKVKNLPPATPGVFLHVVSTNPSFIITDNAGSVPSHDDEVEILNSGEGLEVPIITGGPGGGTAGAADIAPFVISKYFDKSSARFRRAVLSGARLTAEIRYYDGTMPTPVYVVRIQNSLMTSFTSTSDNNCGGGCPAAVETFSLRPMGTITWTNNKTSTPQVITYNVSTNVTTYSGL